MSSVVEPRAEDVAALDGVDDRRLPRRQHPVQLRVGAGHLEAVARARHLPLHLGHHHQQALPRAQLQQLAPAAR